MFVLIAFIIVGDQPTFFELSTPASYEECLEEKEAWKPIIKEGVDMACMRTELM